MNDTPTRNTQECEPNHYTFTNRSKRRRLLWWLLPGVLGWAIAGFAYASRAHVVRMSWWDEFSLARFFDSPVIFGTVMGITGLFVLFYIIVALRASALERTAADWAGDRWLAELVEALDESDDQLAFVRIRYLRSERLYTRLFKHLPAEEAAKEAKSLLAGLPDNDETERLRRDVLSSESNKDTRREALIQLSERRDEQLQRLLMARLRQVKGGGSVSVHVVYLLEDLAASEARPLLERLLSSGEIPERILRSALRRIPRAQATKAK